MKDMKKRKKTKLVELREGVDACDTQLILTLAKRMRLSAKIAALKVCNGQPILCSEVEKKRRARVKNLAKKAGMKNLEVVDAMYVVIIGGSHKVQFAIKESIGYKRLKKSKK